MRIYINPFSYNSKSANENEKSKTKKGRSVTDHLFGRYKTKKEKERDKPKSIQTNNPSQIPTFDTETQDSGCVIQEYEIIRESKNHSLKNKSTSHILGNRNVANKNSTQAKLLSSAPRLTTNLAER